MPVFDLLVRRTGYAHTTVVVEDACAADACAIAQEEAIEREPGEHTSDYAVIHAGEDDYPAASSAYNLPAWEQGRRGRWEVCVCRLSYGLLTLPIEAADYEVACGLALDAAGNHYFPARSFDTTVTSCTLQAEPALLTP